MVGTWTPMDFFFETDAATHMYLSFKASTCRRLSFSFGQDAPFLNSMASYLLAFAANISCRFSSEKSLADESTQVIPC
jgi:hypothetical protein